jgi:LPXTG-site transpeptidase (sortase) family protein
VLAGLSAISWHDGSASTAQADRPAGITSHTGRSASHLPKVGKAPRLHRPAAHHKPVRLVPARPERLVLPSIGVSASVTPIGTDGARILVPPADYTTVGWWSQGARPGEGFGTTIIAGHTVHTGGGALDNLGSVSVGDRVWLQRARQSLRYDVTSVTTYRKGTLATRAAQVFNQSGPERLAIVTCGDWNGEIYLSNVVVIATNPKPVPTR